MKINIRKSLKNLFNRFYRKHTHSEMEMVHIIIQEQITSFGDSPVFIETGSGISTLALAKAAKQHSGKAYSCDCNETMLNELKKRASDQLEYVTFMIGDSITSLEKIVSQHKKLDFVFLDSAASAMHTFNEFKIIESSMVPGSCLLIDNATLPEEKWLLSPCRKGKILVPYLLASANWQVRAHPRAGGSMISAVFHREPNYSDSRYERAENIEYWKSSFDKNLAQQTFPKA